jgi:hypothetical protein
LNSWHSNGFGYFFLANPLKKRTAKVNNYSYYPVKNQESYDFGKTDTLAGLCGLILSAETYSCLTLSGFLIVLL